jgi:hypothetical protein
VVEYVAGGGASETGAIIGFPGEGLGIFAALSDDASEDAPPGTIDAVPAGGLAI